MRPASGTVSMIVWAAREMLRRPGRNLLVGACLTSVTFMVAVALLFSQALDATWHRLIDQAPDLIVRRLDAGGWAPMPAETAVACAAAVPGAIDPTPRLWGVVQGPQGPMTVVAATGVIFSKTLEGLTPPSPGQVVVSRGVAASVPDKRLTLTGQRTLTLEINGTFPAGTDFSTDDLAWMAPVDVRRLLDLAPGQVSDLAVFLFHREEATAIQTDLTAAFPWPVRIIGRNDDIQWHREQAARMGGIAVVACVPAILALAWIVGGTIAMGGGQQAQQGLLRCLGWTIEDLLRLQLAQAGLLCVPCVAVGLASAYAVVFYPPAAGIAAWWLTGGRHLPALFLSRAGTLPTLVEIIALVIVPYTAAVFLSTVKGTVRSPWNLMREAPWD